MADLIDRQAAIDALEEPCKVSDTWTDEYAVGERMQWKKDVKALNSLPSTDAIEVVRCKDCKWYEPFYTLNGNEFRCCCRETRESLRNSDDYCSYGERK